MVGGKETPIEPVNCLVGQAFFFLSHSSLENIFFVSFSGQETHSLSALSYRFASGFWSRSVICVAFLIDEVACFWRRQMATMGETEPET